MLAFYATALLPLLFSTVLPSRTYPYSVVTQLNDTHIEIRWGISWKKQIIRYRIHLSGKPVAWFLIGQSDHGEYKGSDFCKILPGGIEDGYIDHNFRFRSDIQQDCIEMGRTAGGAFRFTKKFHTCDMRDYDVEEGTTQFLVAAGHAQEKSLLEASVSKVIIYGKLLQKTTKNVDEIIEESSERLEITANDAVIPDEITTYWCSVIRVDQKFLLRKHHIIKVEALVTKDNEHLVHHMELFGCQHPEHDVDLQYEGNCNDPRKPAEAHGCTMVIAAWAMGAGPVVYPTETGMPFGGPGFYPYLMLEIHYNNVERTAGVHDSSGFLISHTDRLRRYDAGVMELGLIYGDANSIPPRQKNFPLTGHCVADCTQKLPATGISVFASQLHAHLYGRKLWTSHYRDGIKIGEINRDNHYSPHWQHIQNLPKIIKIKPGDVLSTTCIYDTSRKETFTWGGYGIEDEMCVNYIHYYPASNVEVCKSAIDNGTLRSFFKKINVNPLMKIREMFEAVKWNQQLNDELRELYNNGELNMHCLQHNGDPFPNHPTKWEHVKQPKIQSGVFEKQRASFDCPAIND